MASFFDGSQSELTFGFVRGNQSGEFVLVEDILDATMMSENESLLIALSACLIGRGECVDDLGPWGAVLGSCGKWRGPWHAASVVPYTSLRLASTDQLPVEPASLSLLLWLDPLSGSSTVQRRAVLRAALRALQPGGVLVAAAGKDEGGNKNGDEEIGSSEAKKATFSVSDFLTLGKEMSEMAEEGKRVVVRRRYHTLSGESWAILASIEGSAEGSAAAQSMDDDQGSAPLPAKVAEGSLCTDISSSAVSGVALAPSVVVVEEGAVGLAQVEASVVVPYDEVLASGDVAAAAAFEAFEAEWVAGAAALDAAHTAPQHHPRTATAGVFVDVASAAARRRRRLVLEAAAKTAAREGWGLGEGRCRGRGALSRQSGGGAAEVSLAVAAMENGQDVYGHVGGGGGDPNSSSSGSTMGGCPGSKSKGAVLKDGSGCGPPKLATAQGKLLPPLPSFHDWRDVFPELNALVEARDVIREEARHVAETGWKEWPEEHYSDGGAQDWKVFPFAHTFPANDPSKTRFIPSTCALCPKTASLLRGLGPLVRTALFSRLGPGARISSHRGWADLANHVLRCHLGLDVPAGGACAVWCDGEVKCHTQGDVVVFDDSKLHKAYNETEHTRVVLIVDLARPAWMPKGRALGGRTPELDNLIEYFS